MDPRRHAMPSQSAPSAAHISHLLDTLQSVVPMRQDALPQVSSSSSSQANFSQVQSQMLSQTPLRMNATSAMELCRIVQQRPDTLRMVRAHRRMHDERVVRWREERGEKWVEAQRKIRVAVSSQLPSSAMDGILRRSEKDLDVVDRGLTADLARMAERCQSALADANVPGFQVTVDPARVAFQRRALQLLLLME